MGSMSDVHAKFAGSIPANYDRYLRPFVFEPYARDLVRRLKAGSGLRVLELACGTGVVTDHLLRALDDGGTIVATDLNPDMIEIARKRLGTNRVEWRVADATSLPFDDGTFDAVLCQYGWMFFPDKPRAMREAHRVLKPAGRLLFNVWDALDRNEGAQLADALYHRVLGADAPTFFSVPYGMSDSEPVKRMLVDAGFSDVRSESVEFTGETESAAHAAYAWLDGSPVLNEIVARRPDAVDSLREQLGQEFARKFGPGIIRTRMKAFVFSATR